MARQSAIHELQFITFIPAMLSDLAPSFFQFFQANSSKKVALAMVFTSIAYAFCSFLSHLSQIDFMVSFLENFTTTLIY